MRRADDKDAPRLRPRLLSAIERGSRSTAAQDAQAVVADEHQVILAVAVTKDAVDADELVLMINKPEETPAAGIGASLTIPLSEAS